MKKLNLKSHPTLALGAHSRILKLIQNNYFLNASPNVITSQIQPYLIQRFFFFQFTIVSLILNLISSTSLLFLSLSLNTCIFQNTNMTVVLLFSLKHAVSCHAYVKFSLMLPGILTTVYKHSNCFSLISIS